MYKVFEISVHSNGRCGSWPAYNFVSYYWKSLIDEYYLYAVWEMVHSFEWTWAIMKSSGWGGFGDNVLMQLNQYLCLWMSAESTSNYIWTSPEQLDHSAIQFLLWNWLLLPLNYSTTDFLSQVSLLKSVISSYNVKRT